MGSKPQKQPDPPKSTVAQLEEQIPVYNRPPSPIVDNNKAKIQGLGIRPDDNIDREANNKQQADRQRRSKVDASPKIDIPKKKQQSPPKQQNKPFVISNEPKQAQLNKTLDLSYDLFVGGLNQKDLKELERQLENDDLSPINESNTEQHKSKHQMSRKLKLQKKKYGNYNKKQKELLIGHLKVLLLQHQFNLNIHFNIIYIIQLMVIIYGRLSTVSPQQSTYIQQAATTTVIPQTYVQPQTIAPQVSTLLPQTSINQTYYQQQPGTIVQPQTLQTTTVAPPQRTIARPPTQIQGSIPIAQTVPPQTSIPFGSTTIAPALAQTTVLPTTQFNRGTIQPNSLCEIIQAIALQQQQVQAKQSAAKEKPDKDKTFLERLFE